MVFNILNQLAKQRGLKNLELNFSDLQTTLTNKAGSEDHADFADAEVKYLVTDGASELMSKKMDDYLVGRQGIAKYVSAVYCPNQNEAGNSVKIVTQGVAAMMSTFGGPRKC